MSVPLFDAVSRPRHSMNPLYVVGAIVTLLLLAYLLYAMLRPERF